MSAHTLTLAADDLAAALRNVRRFTIKLDEGTPALQCVHVEAAGGVLAASATNRYVAGHARVLATGVLPAVLINRRWAKLLASALAHLPEERGVGTVVHLRRLDRLDGDGVLEVSASDGMLLRVPAEPPKHFPSLAKLYAGLADAPAGLDAPIGLDPRWVALFARAAEDFHGQVRWHFAGPTRPVRVQIEDTFTGLIMPVKLPHGMPEPPLTPVGLATLYPTYTRSEALTRWRTTPR